MNKAGLATIVLAAAVGTTGCAMHRHRHDRDRDHDRDRHRRHNETYQVKPAEEGKFEGIGKKEGNNPYEAKPSPSPSPYLKN